MIRPRNGGAAEKANIIVGILDLPAEPFCSSAIVNEACGSLNSIPELVCDLSSGSLLDSSQDIPLMGKKYGELTE